MQQLLVGVDGSAASEAALTWSARLAAALGVELLVARAWTPGQAEVSPDSFEELKAEAAAELNEWCDRARQAGATVRSTVLEEHPDDAAGALLAASEAEGSDVVVVGMHEAKGPHLGSVAHHLAHHTTRPLAMVPQPFADRRVARVVVGVDGSVPSTAAAAFAGQIALSLGAEVVAVLAFEPLLEWVPESDPRSWRPEAEHKLAEWTAPLAAAGVDVAHVLVEDIHPVAALTEVATHQDADLLVVGTHGLAAVTGVRLGGVALELLHHAGRPVMVVPPPAVQSDH